MTDKMDDRIITLEIYISEQEKRIAELSDVMAEQWKTIQTLSKRLDRVQHELVNLKESQDVELNTLGVSG